MSFDFTEKNRFSEATRRGITQNKTEEGKNTFTRKLKAQETLPLGRPEHPVNGVDLKISAEKGAEGNVVAYATNSTIQGTGPVSVTFEKGSNGNTYSLVNTTGDKTTAVVRPGSDNNVLSFNKILPPGQSPSPVQISNGGSGNKFTGSVGPQSSVDNQGSNASYGAANEPFRMGANSSFIGNSNGANLYFNVDMGPYSTFQVNTSVANGSTVRLGENSNFYGGPNLSGDFTIDYTGSTAHSSSTSIDLPGYTKTGQTPDKSGDIYTKSDPNTGDTISTVTVRPPESAGGPHVNTDPGNLSSGYPAWDAPLGM